MEKQITTGEERRDTLGRRIGNAGVPRSRRSDAASVLPRRGVLSDGVARRDVSYVFHDGCDASADRNGGAFHIAPVRAYGAEPMAPHVRAILRFPFGAYASEGTSQVQITDAWDGTRTLHGGARAARATLTGARDSRVVSYWRDRHARDRIAQWVASGDPRGSTQYPPAPPVKRDTTPRCDCDAMGRGVRHDHARDSVASWKAPVPCSALHRDAYGAPIACATCDATTARYRRTVAQIATRERAARVA
jgi:hypothetical protein